MFQAPSYLGQSGSGTSNRSVLSRKGKPARLGCAVHWETSHLQNPGLRGSNPLRASKGSSSQVPSRLALEQEVTGSHEVQYSWADRNVDPATPSPRPCHDSDGNSARDSHGLGFTAQAPSCRSGAGEKIAANETLGTIPETAPQVARAYRGSV